MEINRAFNGKLNMDAANYRMPPSDYRDALNITRDSELSGNDKVVSNIVGNTFIPYNLPNGINKRIGSKEDIYRNRLYYWIWNSLGYHSLVYYDKTNDVVVRLIENLTDTGDVDILEFNPSWKINHADIIYRDEGDLLSWTDGYSSPKEVNVQFLEDGVYPVLKLQFIEKAKRPPLSQPTGVYGSDTSRNANGLRRKLFQFASRFGYDNYEKSTFSTYSKIPLPVGYYGSDNDIDNTNNNFITVTVETGDENVRLIEIAMRSNIENAWSDFVLIAALDKDQLAIPDNSTYSFLFYNDNIYPPIDITEAIQLFDWCPKKAYTQCLPNGNVINYGAITEGYNNYPVDELDVTITAANQTNIPPDTDPPSITYTTQGNITYVYKVNGSSPVPDGTVYRVIVSVPIDSGAPITGIFTLTEYTSQPGDNISDVVAALFNASPAVYRLSEDGTNFIIELPSGSITLSATATAAGGGSNISTEKTWLWDANYVYGIVYVDEQNRDMPGVTTYTNPVASDNDFLVTTPSFSVDGSGNVQTPVVSAEVNHLPPAGAVKYYWVRRRLTYGTFMMYETCDFQEDSDYMYFCLANIEAYKEANSNFIYGTAPIEDPESRLKVIAGVTGGVYNGDYYNQDYQILGTVTKPITGGTSPDNDKLFIKVKKPASALVPAYTTNMLVMVYTPAVNPSSAADSVYWEWGEAYDIYELDDVMYHRGQTQDQTASQPATFVWPEGDVFFHQRQMYNEILTLPFDPDTLNVMDANFSDFFDSAVNDNGRAQVIEVNAKETYYPTLDRFSREFQSGTTINQTNRFFFENQDEYDRSFGDIRKMFIEGRYMYVFQKFDIGAVPILTQIVRDVSGNPLEANSDQLLNKISYPYIGQVGIGDLPESFAANKYAKYGCDNNKGVAWRLSRDGLTIMSVLYECNSFFIDHLTPYKKDLNNGVAPPNEVYAGDPTVYGVYNSHPNKYIICFEEITRYSDATPPESITLSIGLDDQILFNGAVGGDFLVRLTMNGSNGDSQQIEYHTVVGDGTHSLSIALAAAINGLTSPLFSGTVVTIPSFVPGVPIDYNYPVFGVTVSNIAGAGVTTVLEIIPDIIFHQDPVTISFSETRDASEGFESKYSYHPEGMDSIGNLLFAWKDGRLWSFNNPVYCNFFGVQYDSYIVGVFNDNPVMKKSFVSMTKTANIVWACPSIETQLLSYGTTPQQSELITQDFDLVEGEYVANFLHDVNSNGGLINGDELKGGFIIIKFVVENANSFVYLNTVSIKYINSPLNIS